MQALLLLAPSIIKAGEDLFQYIAGARKTAQQNGEWSDAEEQAFQDLVNQRNKEPWQQPMDPPSPAPAA